MQPVRARVCLSGCVQLSVGSAPSGCTSLDNISVSWKMRHEQTLPRNIHLGITVWGMKVKTQHCGKKKKKHYFTFHYSRITKITRLAKATHANLHFMQLHFPPERAPAPRLIHSATLKPKCKTRIQIICKVTKTNSTIC